MDITAADTLTTLFRELEQQGIELWFAGLKGPVKDQLRRFGMGSRFDESHFYATLGTAVDALRDDARHDEPDDRPGSGS